MRKITFFIVFFISVLSANAFYYNGLYFYPSSDGKSCECRGFDPNFQIPSNYTLSIPSVAINTDYNQYVSLPVTSIADKAFMGYIQIDHVVIPSTVERIGAQAFSSCINLEELILYPSTKEIGNSAFFGCLSLTTLNTCAETIGSDAFRGCNSLSIVNLGAGVKYIEPGAFKGCTALTNIEIPFTTQRIGSGIAYLYFGGVFEDCLNLLAVTFSYNLTDKLPQLSRVGDNTFKNCINLPRIDFPYSTTYIGYDAFLRCTSLKHIEWGGPNKLSIGQMDFTGVPLSRMVCHGNISISNNDLQKLSNLVEVRYDSYATQIDYGQFKNMPSLAKVHLEKVKKIDYFAFAGCTGLKDLTLSNELEEIGSYSFQNCSSLEKVEIPQNVKSIMDYAFNGCKNVSEIKLNVGLEKVYNGAFRGCHGIRDLTLPMSVNNFDFSAIDSCSNLKSFTLGGPTPLYISYGKKISTQTPIETLTLRGNLTGTPFIRNENLKQVKFTDYCDEIYESAFYDCVNLTNPDFSNIKKINNFAFQRCTSLTSIDLSNVEYIGTFAFYGCENLREVKFGNNISEIPDILSYSGITSLTIPNNVTKFNTPSNCNNLEKVTLGDGITDVNGNFYGCDKLKYLRLGSNTTSINFSPNSLEKIIVATSIPPRTSGFQYTVYDNAELVVPIGASPSYKEATYWKNFSKITEEDMAGVELVESQVMNEKIFIGDGFIDIYSPSPCVIYNVEGKQIKFINPGKHVIYLPKGIYIISNGNSKRKVKI